LILICDFVKFLVYIYVNGNFIKNLLLFILDLKLKSFDQISATNRNWTFINIYDQLFFE